MKNLILSTTILFFGQFTAQCVKLYVKEHLSGSPICQLSQGDYIEICEDDNEVNGCPRDFYVYDKGSSYGSFTYELSLDKGWSTHYMTLMVNPTTKRFGFILQGQTAMYSYYTESETESNRASQAERDRIINQNRIEQAKAFDEKTKVEINSALEQKEYFKALQLFSLLNYKDDGLLIKINEGWLPEKERYTKLYQDYTTDFNQVKKEYYTSEKDFYIKHAENIKSKKISINGKEAYLKRIASTSDQTAKIYRENALNHDAYVYTKFNQKHLICPVGIDGNYNVWRYNEAYVNNLNIELFYDTVANTYVPMIRFYKDDQLVERCPIVNTTVFQTNCYSMPFPMEMNALYQSVVNESGKRILDELFPQQILNLNSSESISLGGLREISYPGDDKRNDKYESLNDEFKNALNDIETLANFKKSIVTKNFYNPSILYLVKKLYPNADTLVFAFGDYKKSLGNLGLHIDYGHQYSQTDLKDKIYSSGINGGSFVPLIKGVIELKNSMFHVYDKAGNYKEVSADLILPESMVALTNLALDKLTLDSNFLFKNFDSRYYTDYVGEFPINFKQLEMGSNQNKAKYVVNDSLNLKILPVYRNDDLKIPYSTRMVYDPVSFLVLNFNIDFYVAGSKNLNLELDKIAKKYFQEMSKYFEFKIKANSKMAIKSLTKANQYLESLKQFYL
jgi:hypothetical protein